MSRFNKSLDWQDEHKLLRLLDAALRDELPVDGSDLDLQRNAQSRQGQQSSGRLK